MAIKNQLLTDHFAAYNADCMEVLPTLPAESVGLSLFSPPFGGALYQYSSDPRDLSNTKDYAEFFEQYAFIIRELHRITMPGRMCAVHCQDIAVMKGKTHHLLDFSGDLIRCHEADGWKYIARYHVWKEPLTVRNRTMVFSLHHKTLCEDSSRCSIANADYLLIFRRSGENTIPITHPTGLMDYAGERTPPPETLKWRGYEGNQIKNAYSQWIWQQYASAFWDDVRIDRTLPYRDAKEENDEKHSHPLQLDVIERAVVMWSNPGEVVCSPFMGVGSEIYGAVLNGRKGLGIELKTTYYNQALHNLKEAIKASAAQKPIKHEAQQNLMPGFDGLDRDVINTDD